MEQTLQVLVAQLLQLFLYLNFLAGNLIEFILDQFGGGGGGGGGWEEFLISGGIQQQPLLILPS